tara:strand:- start:471 stop:1547 length:1077 start_codon:yes stop_codon:yes gene_type:complete
MPLFNITERQYYENSISFTATANQTTFELTFNPLPTAETEFEVFVNDVELNSNQFSYSSPNVTLPAQAAGAVVVIRQITQAEQLGNYQYIGIDDLIANFQVGYVGENKIIKKIKIPEISFHIQRAIAELSYDTLRSEKTQEIEVPTTLRMRLPHDYVNYVKLTWTDNAGVERIIYPARKTSNPKAILQSADFDYLYNEDDSLLESLNSDTLDTFQSTSTDNTVENVTGPDTDATLAEGRRYGIEPEHSQFNGLFMIDNRTGYIFFSSGISGKTVTLKYISDSLGTEDEIRVHKLAEEAVYKHVAHAVLASRMNTPEYIINRYKKERFATARVAKLRLSNLKSEEINLIMKNKSKTIKH